MLIISKAWGSFKGISSFVLLKGERRDWGDMMTFVVCGIKAAVECRHPGRWYMGRGRNPRSLDTVLHLRPLVSPRPTRLALTSSLHQVTTELIFVTKHTLTSCQAQRSTVQTYITIVASCYGYLFSDTKIWWHINSSIKIDLIYRQVKVFICSTQIIY